MRNRHPQRASSPAATFDRLLDAVGIAPPADANRRSSPRLVNIDVAPDLRAPRSQTWIPLIATAILAGLALVALRDEVMDMSYALADTGARERELLAEKRALTVEMRRLRDPARLVERAAALGFQRPEKVIDLQTRPTPEVAAGPVQSETRP